MVSHLEKVLKSPEQLAELLALHPPEQAEQPDIPAGFGSYPEQLTDAAVLLLLQPDEEGTRLWFVQRSAALRRHAGQIAFPGGKREGGDDSLWHTALRESHEEIGLAHQGVRQLGELNQCWTPSGFRIHPFVAWNEGEAPSLPPNCEIERAFSLPLLELLLQPPVGLPWPRYATAHGTIWGATGRILYRWLEILQKASPERGGKPGT